MPFGKTQHKHFLQEGSLQSHSIKGCDEKVYNHGYFRQCRSRRFRVCQMAGLQEFNSCFFSYAFPESKTMLPQKLKGPPLPQLLNNRKPAGLHSTFLKLVHASRCQHSIDLRIDNSFCFVKRYYRFFPQTVIYKGLHSMNTALE